LCYHVFFTFSFLSGQITDDTSLFTYPEGFSVANFSDPDRMTAFLDEVLDSASNETRALCGNNPECIFDATETGNMEIGLETLQTNQENINDQIVACEFRNPVAMWGEIEHLHSPVSNVTNQACYTLCKTFLIE
jgi:hypothetical protein